MYRGVIGYGVYLPMIMLYTLVGQGIARESTPYKRYLKGVNPIFDEIGAGVVCLPSEVLYALKTGV